MNTRDAYFEDQIVKDLHHIKSLIGKDKAFWNELGYDGDGYTVDEIVGFMLKGLAERGSKIAQTGKIEDATPPSEYKDPKAAPLPRKEAISIQPGDVPVLTFPHQLSQEGNDLAEKAMAKLFPDNEALILDGGTTLEVYREQGKTSMCEGDCKTCGFSDCVSRREQVKDEA